MLIAILKEITNGETRVAITPDLVKKYVSMGMTVQVETNAGLLSGFSDNAYKLAGAKIKTSAAETYENAELILKIWSPEASEYQYLNDKMIIIANFQALANKDEISEITKTKITGFALDLMPRISRAQSMDILSSQSNLAGYKAVIEAVNLLPQAIPMMMTAAGTIAPAKVLILGAGVAGLQAIATAKRLGAQTFASDVRPQVKEQVESLNAKFVEVKTDEVFETSGGYAKETSDDYKKKQSEAVAEQLTKTNIAITTALIPGRKAPILITKEMIKNMPTGAIIIDMATASGGNVEGAVDKQTIIIDGVTIIGDSNLAARLPNSASQLFSKNIFNFLSPMYNKETSNFVFDFEDELISKTCVCKNGENL